MSDTPVATAGRQADRAEGQSDKKFPYYRPTTADQRKLLFRVYEETGNVREAAATAHMGKSTLYYWRKRFDVGGYGALEVVGSHRLRSNPRQLPSQAVGRKEH